MNKISASIVAYKNDLGMLNDAIKSCLNSFPELNLSVVDNSPKNSAKTICESLNVNYIFNGENLGFGRAHNLAIRKHLNSSKYHIIVNPDVYFEKDVIPKLYRYMEEHTNVGVVMPKVYYPDGRLQYLCKLLPKPHHLIYRRFLRFHESQLEKYNHLYEMRFTGYDQVIDVPFVSGCFMFVRTDALRKVGLFDERIFLYTEDIDLSRRMNRHYQTRFYPKAQIYHHHARRSYKDLRILWHHIVSGINYFNKWGWFYDTERDEINQRVLQSCIINGKSRTVS